MRIFFLILLSLSFTKTVLGQQTPLDSGFTNKAEARNELVNDLKEGKWCVYVELVPVGKHKNHNFTEVITTDSTKATYYRLTCYINGVAIGTEREYYMNGKLEGEVSYASGKRFGESKGYYPDGKLAFEIPFVDDKRSGTAKLYYESGKLKSEIIFVDGKQSATTNYDENGKVIN